MRSTSQTISNAVGSSQACSQQLGLPASPGKQLTPAELDDTLRYPNFFRLACEECHEPLERFSHKSQPFANLGVVDKKTIDKLAKSLISTGFPLKDVTSAPLSASKTEGQILKRKCRRIWLMHGNAILGT